MNGSGGIHKTPLMPYNPHLARVRVYARGVALAGVID